MLGAARPSPAAPPLLPGMLRGLYAWLDGLPLSRPKRHLARDFSDGGEGGRGPRGGDGYGRPDGWPGKGQCLGKGPRSPGSLRSAEDPGAGVRGALEGMAGREKGDETKMGALTAPEGGM